MPTGTKEVLENYLNIYTKTAVFDANYYLKVLDELLTNNGWQPVYGDLFKVNMYIKYIYLNLAKAQAKDRRNAEFDRLVNEVEIKPCKGDPVFNPEIAPQYGGSGTKGALQGCTRYGGTCTGGTEGRNKSHAGIDIKSSYGNPIYAMYDGFIFSTKYQDKAGYYTRIQSTANEKTFIHEYYHLQKEKRILQGNPLVKVKSGDIIGYQGNSGNLKNEIKKKIVESHVHIEIREHDGSTKWGYKNFKIVDPRTYFSAKIKDDGTSEKNTNCN
jgi:murein DD-endopeptidase MepM/ murein hydrolase activator NlpD